jgi:membrane protease YdiL (CAAX protease family)
VKLSALFPEKKRETDENESGFLAVTVAALAYFCLLLGQSVLSALFAPHFPRLAGTLSLFGAALVILPLYCARRPLDLRRSALYLDVKKKASAKHFLIGLGLGFAALAFLIGILLVLGAYKAVGVSFGDAAYLPLLLLAFCVQGSAEELLCRGFVMARLGARHGGVVAAFGSALFFSISHLLNPGVSFFGLLNILLFGLLFASVTQKTKSLFIACGIHAGWNFSLSLFGIRISGVTPVHSFFTLESRIDWLSGGAFGVEGSAVLTVLLLLTLIFFYLFSKSKKMA